MYYQSNTSKHVYATTTHHHQHSPSRYSKQPFYISSLDKLDRLANRYQPKNVLENQKYEELCNGGKCALFEISSSNYRYYFIHRNTSNDILNDLIDFATATKTYTLDTEDQLQRPPQPSRGALIEIEFIHEQSPSILILIETMYLPPEESLKFNKIKQLCQVIFSNNHRILSWENVKSELEKFYEFNLFNRNDINQIEPENIQDKFKDWFSDNYPSPYVDIKINEKYSLQLAIFLTFNQWLDKRMTLANWGCGIDLSLNTIFVPRKFKNIQDQVIEDERQYRQLLTKYALNDCSAVTQLVQKMGSSSSSIAAAIAYENISEDDDEINYALNPETINLSSNDNDQNANDLILNVKNNLVEQGDKNTTQVHEQYEPYDIISDDELDDISLPEIMKIHRPFITPYSKRNESYNDDSCKQNDVKRVRVRDEPDNDIEDISDDEPKKKKMKQFPDFDLLTKNQRKNRNKRANRYRFEVIRPVYHKFTIRNIKKILLFMNISYVNINVVGTTLFIGLKNEQIQKTVDIMLNDSIFTKEHYNRIRKQLHLEPR